MPLQSGQTNTAPPRRIAGGVGGGGDLLSMPDAAEYNCIWVQKTSYAYAADGSVQYPYTSIDDAVNAAGALVPAPGASNPVAIIIMPGEYEEVVELDTDHVYLFAWDRDTTILWNADTPLEITSEHTAVWGLTIRTYGVNEVTTIDTVSTSDFVEFNECTFEIIDMGDIGGSPIDINGSAARFIDCKFLNSSETRDTFDIHGASTVELWDCSVEGVLNLDQNDDCYLYRCTFDDGKIVSGTSGALFIFECRIITAAGSAVTLDAATQLEIKSSYLDSQANNKDIDASTAVTGVVIDNNVMMADGIHEDISHVNPIKYVGSAGDKDFYLTVQEGLNSSTFDNCVVKLLKDETTSFNPPANRIITVDGNGMHSIGGPAVGQAACHCTVRDANITDRAGVTGNGATLRLENCTSSFRIGAFLNVPLYVEIVDCDFTVTDAAFPNVIYLSNASAEVTILRSRLKGYSHAIYWGGGKANDNVKISYSTIWHGSGGANNPYGRSAAQTPNWKGAHNAFNVDPDAAGWSTNLVAAGQQQTSFDVNTDY